MLLGCLCLPLCPSKPLRPRTRRSWLAGDLSSSLTAHACAACEVGPKTNAERLCVSLPSRPPSPPLGVLAAVPEPLLSFPGGPVPQSSQVSLLGPDSDRTLPPGSRGKENGVCFVPKGPQKLEEAWHVVVALKTRFPRGDGPEYPTVSSLQILGETGDRLPAGKSLPGPAAPLTDGLSIGPASEAAMAQGPRVLP